MPGPDSKFYVTPELLKQAKELEAKIRKELSPEYNAEDYEITTTLLEDGKWMGQVTEIPDLAFVYETEDEAQSEVFEYLKAYLDAKHQLKESVPKPNALKS